MADSDESQDSQLEQREDLMKISIYDERLS